MSYDIDLFHMSAEQLRANPETLGVRVSREHYLWIADEIDGLHGRIKAIVHVLGGEVDGGPTSSINALQRIRQLRDALDESVKLQSHYAGILNIMDWGERLQFSDGEDFIARLRRLGK